MAVKTIQIYFLNFLLSLLYPFLLFIFIDNCIFLQVESILGSSSGCCHWLSRLDVVIMLNRRSPRPLENYVTATVRRNNIMSGMGLFHQINELVLRSWESKQISVWRGYLLRINIRSNPVLTFILSAAKSRLQLIIRHRTSSFSPWKIRRPEISLFLSGLRHHISYLAYIHRLIAQPGDARSLKVC